MLTRENFTYYTTHLRKDGHVEPSLCSTDAPTPRQTQILKLLAYGNTYSEIAKQLDLSAETIKNHLTGYQGSSGLYKRLGVGNGMQAVIAGLRLGDIKLSELPVLYDFSVFDGLTGQEFVVMQYLVRGLQNPKIAAELYLSVNTVNAHVKNIFRKSACSSREQLAVGFFKYFEQKRQEFV